MYIIELFINWLNKNKRGTGANPDGIFKSNNETPEDEAITCQHNFMPVDSTGEVLACTKCGLVIKKNKKFRG